ncbi:PREDICTED: Golgi integral membrane protein 4-like isoform X1 [Eufriesea mexicana]|uniref:Golgi integral membrane protein 4-like isoform X1 n=1 Tax=Eufriesea mexicana TaxID=516756 RepID=UPI00083C4B34|nr:PREDICTED: Golgi integral membrane protein 4-like isoform X1 [Eufriesea mexicana]XP_017755881.1 PREDICTED: Golgi integral membrane protein 4-like isoform X1 [Eufriesea mexicana]
MSSSRLGRGRGGRLAVYGGCGVVVLLLVFLYRAATSEMARLRELNVQCAHQQEALAAQLQVIFEYKVRLEKSLSEEKSSNAAVKQELQQRASREKTLRDKDSIEAMQRFNSLQQTCKLLQIEHQDLQEECKKRDQQALEDTNKLETTLRELRSRIRQAREDKKKTLEDLKNKFLELDTKKNELEQKYNSMLKNNSIEYLKTEVIHLKQELEKAKKSLRKATSPGPSVVNPQAAPQTKSADLGSAAQPVDQSQQQQVSPPTADDKNPQPLYAPVTQDMIEDPLQSNEQRANEVNNFQFALKNGNIVPVGPNEIKKAEVLPLPYDLEERRQKKADDQSVIDDVQIENNNVIERDENRDDEKLRQVLPPPKQNYEKYNDNKSSTNLPGNAIGLEIGKNLDDKKYTTDSPETRVSWLKQNKKPEINLESTVATSSMKSIPALKLETSTPASSGNPASMAMDKGFPIGKPAPKAKLPVGVPPIPIMIDQKVENHEEKQDEIARKREEPKQKNNGDSKEQEAENGNLDPPFPANPARRADDQVADRRGNGWFNVGPGVQEIGDELNHIRLAGLDVGAERIADAGDDQYEGVEYDKEPQQKDSDLRLVEGEDEGEDEDDQIDYPHNLKQEKRE